MTFEPDAWLDDDDDALDQTCDVEYGSVHDPTTVEDVACFIVPPDRDRQREHAKIFIKDEDGIIPVGGRITYNEQVYLVESWERDGEYLVGDIPTWNEAL